MQEGENKPRRSIGARRNPETEEAILNAAQEVLQEAGYAGFSIEAVARRARAGKPTIYRWWRGKGDLLLEVYRRSKGNFRFPDTGDLAEDLTLFVGKLLGHWRTNRSGQIFRSILAEAQHDEITAEAVADYFVDRRDYVAGMAERAQRRGELAPDIDPKLVAELAVSFAWNRLFTHRCEIGEDELRAIMRIIVHGAAAKSAAIPSSPARR
ncbi:TetR/AcrR family transcriptional regulator [Chelativorans sp.]|uniref:TetR/AcrR family transcriptional regulator n=1 Tax=Chelativorans sp. TaxID=2203393 RepID=UPI0028113772|nr:TetR/AcrR family transcriptional regulator [Chelativorans sp.]